MLSEVPEEWQKAQIGELFSVVTKGTTPTSVGFSFEESGVPFIKVENVSEDGRIDSGSMSFVSEECHRKLARSVISKNTILYSIAGTIGRTAVYLEEHESNTNQALALMHGLDASRVSQSFIVQYLRSSVVKNIFEAQKTVGAQPNISLKQLKELPVPFPPINEQQRIGEILSSVDASIQATQAVIEQVERVKRGFIRERILGGLSSEKIFEGEPPENAKLKTIAQVTESLNNRRIPIKKSERLGGEYPYYGATGIIDYVKDYIFDEQILLISEDGANLVDRNYPIAYSVEGRTWVNNHAHVLKVNSPAQQKVLEEYFNEVPLTKFLTGMAQPKLNKAALSAIPVPVFLEEEALVLAETIAALDASIAHNKTSMTQLQVVKRGLMDDLLTGKVRTV